MPTSLNWKEKSAPGSRCPLSQMPAGLFGVPELIVCGRSSWLSHLTIVPRGTVKVSRAKSSIRDRISPGW